MTNLPQDELLWSAFRYVSGEMDADEQAAFESKLADDQSAREAVADAVALGVAAAHTRPVAAKSAAAHPRLREWLAVGVAAGLLGALFALGRPAQNDRGTSSEPFSLATAELAETWAQTRSAVTDDSTPLGGDTLDEAAFDEFPSFALGGDEQQLTTPDWMLAALLDIPAERAEAPLDREDR